MHTSVLRAITPIVAFLLLVATVLWLPPSPAAAEEAADPTRGRGTVLGSTAYPVPAGAIHVSSSSGSDSNPGTATRPLRTVNRAVEIAPAGSTIVLRGGTYHESVTVKRKVTIQNYPNEVVWFDGSSPVTGWTRTGSAWSAPWSTFFAPQQYPGGVRPDHPYAHYPAQVFIDGAALREVGRAADVVPGTFYADASARRLVIGTDPGGRSVRASDLTYGLHMWTDVTLRGFGVRRYAAGSDPRAAIVSDPAGGVFEHLVIADNAAQGLAISGANKAVRNVVVERNGMIGIGANRTDNLVITNSIVRGNNTERFPTLPQASGVKIHKSNGVVFRNNLVQGTHNAAGLWFDHFNSGVTIVGNDLIDNGEVQLNFEVSRRGVVADNIMHGGKKSLDLRNSEDVQVYNNLMRAYTLIGIFIPQDSRWRLRPSDAPADFSLRTLNNTIANNSMGCGTRFQIFGQDEQDNLGMDAFRTTINGNVFSPTSSSPELNIVGWGLPNNGFQFIRTLAELRSKNSTWNNLQHSACVADPAAQLTASQLSAVAVPLPASVANATGAPAGTRTVGLLRNGAPVAPAPAPGPAPAIASDAFNRTQTGGWGNADAGGAWTLIGGSSAFSVSNGRGSIQLAPTHNREAILSRVSGTSLTTQFKVSIDQLPQGTGASLTLIGRRVGSSHYGARLRIAPDASVLLYALRDETALVPAARPVTTPYRPGQEFWVKTSVTGTSPTTIRVKTWAHGTPEPKDWQLTATDSTPALQKAGTVGVKTHFGGAGVGSLRIRVDDFSTR